MNFLFHMISPKQTPQANQKQLAATKWAEEPRLERNPPREL